MRNLTITRTKSFVACLVKMKVYIEDAMAGELTINGVSCRKLGILKNGETATFSIGDQAARVFVIADKASRNFSNDYYTIPAGTEDIVLTGKNHFNPGAGNAFLFDGVTDPEILANRKKGSRKGIVILVVAALLGFLVGFLPTASRVRTVQPKEFSAAGMTITLNTEFKEASYQGYTQCYETRTIAVLAVKEEFTLMAGFEDYTLEEYGALVLQSNGMDLSELEYENGVYYFDFTALGGDGREYYYFATLHKGNDAFWLIQFATPVTNQEKVQDDFFEWAASVTFQ